MLNSLLFHLSKKQVNNSCWYCVFTCYFHSVQKPIEIYSCMSKIRPRDQHLQNPQGKSLVRWKWYKKYPFLYVSVKEIRGLIMIRLFFSPARILNDNAFD